MAQLLLSASPNIKSNITTTVSDMLASKVAYVSVVVFSPQALPESTAIYNSLLFTFFFTLSATASFVVVLLARLKVEP